MRLLYATTARLPTHRAHGLQIVASCAAFAAAGAEVTLAVADRSPERGIAAELDPRDHAGLPHGFRIERVPCVDPGWRRPGLEPAAFRLMAASFGIALRRRVARHGRDAVVYSRDPIPLLLLGAARSRPRLVYEAHQLPVGGAGRWLQRRVVRRAELVVAVTGQIAAAAAAAGARRTLVARDGYRDDLFAGLPSREAARSLLGLPREAFLVGYSGQLATLGMAKGVEQLLDAAAALRDLPLAVVVVGGSAEEVEELRRRWQAAGGEAERLIAPGQLPPAAVPTWLAALDVGTVPLPDTPHFALCASPLKLFEYLAAGLPIVASDLPSLAEVVTDGETALLTPPADVVGLAAALRRLEADPDLRARLAAGARRLAPAFSWSARVELILGALDAAAAAPRRTPAP